MIKVLYLCLSLFGVNCFAKVELELVPRVFINKYKRISTLYKKKIVIPYTNCEKIEKIIMRTKSFGEYAPVFSCQNNVLSFNYFPLSYKEQTDLLVNEKQGQLILKSFMFKNPTPLMIQNKIKLLDAKGELPKFLLTTGFIKNKKNNYGRNYLYLLNKLGEVIWLHFLNKNSPTVTHSVVVKKDIGESFLVMLENSKRTYFERVDLSGNIKSYSVKNIAAHHDFILEKEGVLYLSTLSMSYRAPFDQKNYKILVPAIFYYDFKERRGRLLWSYREQAVTEELKGKMTFDPKTYGHDIWHANSLTKSRKGYLVSLRNTSTMIHLSKDFRKTFWVINPQTKIKGLNDPIFGQHTLTELRNGNFLLMDNGLSMIGKRNESRVLELRLKKNKNWELVREFGQGRGIVAPSKGGVIEYELGRFSSFNDRKNKELQLFVFKRQSFQVRGSVKLKSEDGPYEYRVLPFFTIEDLLKGSLNENK